VARGTLAIPARAIMKHPPLPPADLPPPGAVAVLLSGGVDSAVLLGERCADSPAVYPLYVRTGLFWEPPEEHHLSLFLRHLESPQLRPLTILDLPARDLYIHWAQWSLTGKDVPGAETPDEAVFLPGRNVLLLSKALLWCHLRGVRSLALGTLAANPFPDATPEFLASLAEVVGRSVDQPPVVVQQPYRALSKADVVRRGRNMPLRWTFSCIRPEGGLHCGRCNKCAERRRAFAEARVEDPTEYRESGIRSPVP
jgi:7-cyano-7-deazaguanine synthase